MAIADNTGPVVPQVGDAASGVAAKMALTGPRKLLAIDGGGVRGGVCIPILAKIEQHLRERSGNARLVLSDYFDYIGGTSVGSILAACLSLGMSVGEVRDFTAHGVADFFQNASIWRRTYFKYSAAGLEKRLAGVFGDETLGSSRLKTFLLMVMRNATTDSPWPISNNPLATFNDLKLADCNLHLPLAHLLRASAAAPTFFPPEEIRVGTRTYSFVDGATTIANNPACQLFFQATLPAYRLCWPTGEDKMLLISVGTGRIPAENASKANILSHAISIIQCMITGAGIQQDLFCRVMGKCLEGGIIDCEIGDLISENMPWPKQFTYCRYDVDLTARGFGELGLTIDPTGLHTIDDPRVFDMALEVGAAVAEKHVKKEHFRGFEP